MQYKLAPTKQFTKMLKALPPSLEKQLKRVLKNLQENPAHPSLRTRNYQSIEDVWESSITIKYRFLWLNKFDQPDTIIILLAVGDHKILD